MKAAASYTTTTLNMKRNIIVSTVMVAASSSVMQLAAAFSPPSTTNHNIIPSQRRQQRPNTFSPLQCICIHCKHVTNCSAYHFVEQQHGQPHINKEPDWEPRDGSPTINVHIRPDEDKTTKNELDKMWLEHEEETRRAEESYAKSNSGQNVDADTALFGDTQYDLSGTTTYEYDVIECEDFVEEKEMWVKNMPEEIRLANPDFVPT